MNSLPMHNALKSLSWLEGVWKTTKSPGQGQFPTIKSFNYHEVLKFTSIGQPMFNYEAQSYNVETGNPMHREVGFLKVLPGTKKVQLILAHNFGLTTIEEGEVGDDKIALMSTSISRVSEGFKEPSTFQLKREFRKVGDTLEHTVWMSTSTTPELAQHLQARYEKQS